MDLRTRKARVSGRLVVSGRVGRHVSRHQGDCKNEWLHKESAWVGVRERGACGRWQTALALEGRVDVEHCEMTLGGEETQSGHLAAGHKRHAIPEGERGHAGRMGSVEYTYQPWGRATWRKRNTPIPARAHLFRGLKNAKGGPCGT